MDLHKIEWKPEYTVGEIDLDVHHKEIFKYLNELLDMLENGDCDTSAADRILSDLVRYADYHFSSEEAYMQQIGYDELKLHRRLHNEFSESLRDFRHMFSNQESEVLQKMAAYLNHWLIKHILSEDKKYYEFCKIRGIEIK